MQSVFGLWTGAGLCELHGPTNLLLHFPLEFLKGLLSGDRFPEQVFLHANERILLDPLLLLTFRPIAAAITGTLRLTTA